MALDLNVKTCLSPFPTFGSTDGANTLEADMTNPLSETERVEYQEVLGTSYFPATESSTPSHSGLTIDNSNLNHANTFYWSRKEYVDGLAAGGLDSPGFYGKAQVTHWAETALGSIPVPLSTKNPLEGRVWFNYQNQPNVDFVDLTIANATTSPSVTARLVDTSSGTATQASFASYNANGMITQSIDPIGRTTNYTYLTNGNVDPNGIDLYQVTQANSASSGGQDILFTASYNLRTPSPPDDLLTATIHLPSQTTDAAGQPTYLTYNGLGQLLTRTVVVNSTNQTTTLAYYPNTSGNSSSNRLYTVKGPITGAVTTYAYDSSGRVQTVTDSEGYVLTYAYDNLDRPTTTTYPDGTTDQTVYKNLDVDHTTDRQGRTSYNTYDAIGELLQTTDPLGRTTKYTWCICGGLASLTDANGNVTSWGLDTQGRVLSKTYADVSEIRYLYQTNTSRLSTMTDARGTVATYNYNADNTLSGVTYVPGTGIATTPNPNVNFYYDSVYNRVTSMVDATGTNSYAYNPINAALGAGRLASVSVPIAGSSAAVTNSYDELGRVVERDVDHATTNANNVSTTYDALGRVTGVTNTLGAFTYGYVNTTSRLQTVTYPSSTGLSTSFTYFPNTDNQDFERLQTIQNFKGGTTNISKFDYTYNPVGTIATWRQQADTSGAVTNTLSYDHADQLTNAVQSGGGSASNGYVYDSAGNRLAEKTASGTTVGQFNILNQLTGISSNTTSQTTVAGYTSAAVTNVTVNAVPATISNSTNFSAYVPLPSGTNVVSVVAQPSGGGGSTTTQLVKLTASGSTPASLSYDANGNCTQDENGNTYTWDALNRLTAIVYGSGSPSYGTHTEFAYDGLSRRVQIVERAGMTVGTGTVNSTKNYLWIGQEIAEERNASNTVTKRFFPQGEQQSGTNYYYTRDHLGSVREMCSSSGAIVARYSYDPYGRTTLVSGTNLATFQYADYYAHQPSGLFMTRNMPGVDGREYDTGTGRWLSRDAIQERGGNNLYEYVFDKPSIAVDPYGTDIYLNQGNTDAPWWQPPNRELHQSICVDTWDDKCCKTGRRCFSFGLSGFGWAAPSDTWLGQPSPNAGGPGRGTVYDSTGCGIWDVKVIKTTCQQDKEFLKMLESMEGTEDTYSVGRHNCRAFSQDMFNQAQKKYGK